MRNLGKHLFLYLYFLTVFFICFHLRKFKKRDENDKKFKPKSSICSVL